MTVPERQLCVTPTQGLATPHKFYPTKIYVPHHQLRHFISTTDGDLIYYATNYDVFVLDLVTQQNSLIATIPFEARCLAADLGWVCVGGEVNGDCAFIELEKDEHGRPTCFGHHLVLELLGGEIVNSMSIHNMVTGGEAPDEPVVLISNNDKTIKVYSLAQRQVLATLHHPVPMNFAEMSPDSTIIAAVGDCDRVYFYRRQLVEDFLLDDGGILKYARYEWKAFAEPVVPTGDVVYDDYSFAVVFSPSGHLCASSSQGGSITVFDMQRLCHSDEPAEKAILCTFRSSRPTLWGCVRSMTFSPAPWDILAWAEDHGRIGLADVRRYFTRRQVLELDPGKVETVDLEDGTPVAYRNLGVKERLKQQHLARLRALRYPFASEVDGELSLDDLPMDHGQGPDRHRRVSYAQDADLDARERSVIEALETTMDNVERLSTHPYSVNYVSSPHVRGSATPVTSRRGQDVSTHSTGSRASGFRPHQPRRRTSVVLSESSASRYLDPNESQRTRMSASPGRMGDEDEIQIESTRVPIPNATESAGSDPPSSVNEPTQYDPWLVIQRALTTARELDRSNRSRLAHIEAALEADRPRRRQNMAERDPSIPFGRPVDTQDRPQESPHLDYLRAVARESNARAEASLARIAQLRLRDEQEFLGEQELRAELTIENDYPSRYVSERAQLMRAVAGDASIMSNVSNNTASSTARTSTLSTTNLRFGGAGGLSNIMTEHTARRQRLDAIDNAERQLRQVQSRVTMASSDIRVLESAIRGGIGQEGTGSRVEDGNQPSRTSTNAANESIWRPASVQPDNSRASRRTQMPMNRETRIERLSELVGRLPDPDLRLARMMFFFGMSNNRSLDANGNWTPEAGLHRVLTGGSSLPATNSGAAGPSTTTTADAVREMGPGTAGIGFSPDGHFLYVGSEEGIYEFKINLRDRMTFPAFEMR